MFRSTLERRPAASLDDVFKSKDEDKPISWGLFTMVAADEPLVYIYDYHELKIISEGEFSACMLESGEIVDVNVRAISGGVHLEDTNKPREVVKAKAGDIIRIEKGATVKFSSPT
jgi:ethanolamine utilization protein EutQ (cupin superfamily)